MVINIIFGVLATIFAALSFLIAWLTFRRPIENAMLYINLGECSPFISLYFLDGFLWT